MVEDGGLDGCKKRDGDVQDALSLEDEVRISDRLIRLFWQVPLYLQTWGCSFLLDAINGQVPKQ